MFSMDSETLDLIASRKIALVATHIGTNAGGEAMKAFQYAEFLENLGADFTVILHERSFKHLGADRGAHDFLIIEDTFLQKFMWKIPPLRPGVDIYFHLKTRSLVRKHFPKSKKTVVHYIAPISPVTPRFPPAGYHIAIGPVSGNIYHPKAFYDRMPFYDKIRATLHKVLQRSFGVIFGDKRQADKVLNSGYDRTRESLYLTGCTDAQIVDVLDSGINPVMSASPRITHKGKNGRFMYSGRMVSFKAFDFAIRALAQCKEDTSLSLFGDGPERPSLEALVDELGLRDRVIFHGWADHDTLIAAHKEHRGYVFPSLGDSNGIVMQEAMMLGLPVVAMRWGGPAALADDTSAIYVDPISQDHVVQEFAAAMDRLTVDPKLAESLSKNARARAEKGFIWEDVAQSWIQAYK